MGSVKLRINVSVHSYRVQGAAANIQLAHRPPRLDNIATAHSALTASGAAAGASAAFSAGASDCRSEVQSVNWANQRSPTPDRTHVVPEELHDQGRVLVRLLAQGVELRDRVVKGLLGEVARAIRRVEDLRDQHGGGRRGTRLVEEHAGRGSAGDRVVAHAPEVQGETEANRVRRREVRLRNLGRLLVRDVGGLRGTRAAFSVGKLGEVAVVVALPARPSACPQWLDRTHILW